MSKENFNHENLFDHLDRYAHHGFAAAISMGADMGELPYQLREEVITRGLFRTSHGGSRARLAGFLAIRPRPQRVPVRGYHPRAGQAGVQDLAPQRPRFVKIWVDDHNHTQGKLTPELYGAAIDEAHKHNRRVRASIDGFTHLVTRQGP